MSSVCRGATGRAEAVSGGGWSGRRAARNGGIARPCGLGYFSAMPSAESSSLPSAATPSLTPDSVAAHCESQLRLLLELARVMNDASDVAQALDKALALMAGHLHMMRGAITLVSPQTGEIRTEAAYGLKPAECRRGRYVRGEGITGRVIESGRPMYISNVSQEPLFLNKTRSRDLKKEGISFICVPIRLNDQVVGALSVDHLLADAATLEDEVRLLLIIATLLGHAALETQGRMDEESRPSLRPKGFVGNSESMQKVYAQIAQVAPSATTVFLQGESGTGKELAARAIHAASARAPRPFISLNCAALPENLIESELFGHERGAFTGASATRKGRFELADGGTLFLDEVGELSLMTQAKLLRVLQERSFERLGGMETRHVDVRFITATNRDLERMVEEGSFRRDLFRGYPAPGRSFYCKIRRGQRAEERAPFPGRDGYAPALRLARQYPRAGKRHGARRAASGPREPGAAPAPAAFPAQHPRRPGRRGLLRHPARFRGQSAGASGRTGTGLHCGGPGIQPRADRQGGGKPGPDRADHGPAPEKIRHQLQSLPSGSEGRAARRRQYDFIKSTKMLF